MSDIFKEFIKPALKRWLLTPFSNKVTKTLLFTGAAVVAAPLIEHIIIKVILLQFFDIDVPIDVPDIPAYAGVALMTIGALHNLSFQYFEYRDGERAAHTRKEAQVAQIPHDKKIIEELLSLLPYENTHHWLEQAAYAGMRRDFTHDLEACEKFITPPFAIYNEQVEASKNELILCIKDFNQHCLGHLGAQEDKSGQMYLPPYHWKSQGKKSEARYYEQVEAMGNLNP
ncbi:hypothetical protein [Endozoicomonas numazuensis]|uniref:hypothetical protein n=1 Tax=Endozoicomonas numazuensis TaxID=1137799 RepID=UPI0009DE7359|nr:hypothetical protein [Endozoicomonas numazuensis]